MTLNKLSRLLVFILFVRPLHGMIADVDIDNLQLEHLVIKPNFSQLFNNLVDGWEISAPIKNKSDEVFKISIREEISWGLDQDSYKDLKDKDFNNFEWTKKIDLTLKGIRSHIIDSVERSQLTPQRNLFLNILTSKMHSIGGIVWSESALHMAVLWELSEDHIKRLLKNGANPFVKDRGGCLPIDLAIIPETRKLIYHRMQEGVKKRRTYLLRILAPAAPVGSIKFHDDIAAIIAEYVYPMPRILATDAPVGSIKFDNEIAEPVVE